MQELLAAVGPNAKRGIRSQITIHKAAIKKNKLVADFTEQLDNEQAGRDFSVTCGDNAHADLLLAFRDLVPSFALLTDQIAELAPVADEDDESGLRARNEQLTPFNVSGVIYDPKGLGFTLIGTRQLASGHTLNLIAPFLKFEEVSQTVERLLEILNEEVELGLRGKCADAGRQLPLPFDQPEGAALLSAGKGGPLLLGPGVEDAEYEDVIDEDGGPDGSDQAPPQLGAGDEPDVMDTPPIVDEQPDERPKKRGRGRPRKQQPAA